MKPMIVVKFVVFIRGSDSSFRRSIGERDTYEMAEKLLREALLNEPLGSIGKVEKVFAVVPGAPETPLTTPEEPNN